MSYSESIIARLGLDTAGFKQGLARSESMLVGFSQKLAGAFGISLGVSGITHGVEKILAYADRIDDLSTRYDVNAESLQRLGNAAELHGSSLEGVAKGYNKLEISQSRALGGNNRMIGAFSALGVSIEDLRQLSPEQIMMKIGKSSLNAADMVTVLGKSALELRPVLEGVAAGTIKFGQAIDAVDVKKLADAHDFYKKMGQNILINSSGGLSGIMNLFRPSTWKEGFEETKTAAKSFFDAIGAAARGNLPEASKHLQDFKKEALGVYSTVSFGKTDAPPDPQKKVSRSEFDLRRERLAEIENSGALDFKLKEIAGRPAVFSNQQTIQEWWAGEQARKVMTLEAKSRREATYDRPGAGFTLDRANQMRDGVSGLAASDRGVSVLQGELQRANTTLTQIEHALQIEE